MKEYQGQKAPGVAERLSALRTPPTTPPAPPQEFAPPSSKVAIKREYLIGGVVVLVVIAVLIPLIARSQTPTLMSKIEAATTQMVGGPEEEVTTDSVVDQSGLTTGEAYLAVPVESGHFPPRLTSGHLVRISINSSKDGIEQTETLPGTATVQAVAPISDMGTTYVVTVLGAEDLLSKIGSASSVDIAIVGEVAQ